MAVIAAVAAAPRAGAQVVRGTVVDSATRRPISGASVVLQRSDSSVAASVRAGADGYFTLLVPAPGTYALLVREFGYQAGLLVLRRMEQGQSVTVNVVLAVVPRLMDTVTTRSSPLTLFRLTPGRTWFARHQAEGKGVFFNGLEVVNTRRSACDYFAAIPGLKYSETLNAAGIPCENQKLITSNTGTECMSGRVDRGMGPIVAIDSAYIYVGTGLPEDLDSLGLRPVQRVLAILASALRVPLARVLGVEVYRNKYELPRDFGILWDAGAVQAPRRFFVSNTRGSRASAGVAASPAPLTALAKCVYVQVWTDIAW
jgi:hypothetical protein